MFSGDYLINIYHTLHQQAPYKFKVAEFSFKRIAKFEIHPKEPITQFEGFLKNTKDRETQQHPKTLHTMKKQFKKCNYAKFEDVLVFMTMLSPQVCVGSRQALNMLTRTVFESKRQIKYVSNTHIPITGTIRPACLIIDVWATDYIPKNSNVINEAALQAMKIHSDRCAELVKVFNNTKLSN